MPENEDPIRESGEGINKQEELSHTDKLTGVFTEPSVTFAEVAKYPPKTMDWLLPIFLLLVITSITMGLVMTNPAIKAQTKDKARADMEKSLSEKVSKGTITQSQASDQMEQGEKTLEYIGSPIGLVLQSVSILFIGFIIFQTVTLKCPDRFFSRFLIHLLIPIKSYRFPVG